MLVGSVGWKWLLESDRVVRHAGNAKPNPDSAAREMLFVLCHEFCFLTRRYKWILIVAKDLSSPRCRYRKRETIYLISNRRFDSVRRKTISKRVQGEHSDFDP